jgi:hypothetical protein
MTIQVNLPDKNLTLNFPDGMNQDDMRDAIFKNFYPEKFEFTKEISLTEEIGTQFKQVGEGLLGAAVGLAGFPLAGLYGLFESTRQVGVKKLGSQKSFEVANEAMENFFESLPLQPKTKTGRATQRVATFPFELLDRAATFVGDRVLDVTGSPAASATAKTMAFMAIPKVAIKVRSIAKAKKMKPAELKATIVDDVVKSGETPSLEFIERRLLTYEKADLKQIEGRLKAGEGFTVGEGVPPGFIKGIKPETIAERAEIKAKGSLRSIEEQIRALPEELEIVSELPKRVIEPKTTRTTSVGEIMSKPAFLRTAEDKVFLKRTLEKEPEIIRNLPDFPETELYAGIPIGKIIPKKFQQRWQEFWKPFSTIPESQKILFERSKQFGTIDRAETFINRIYGKLKPFEKDIQKDIFRYLDGKLELVDLPKEARPIAKSILERTKTIGKMLVKRGILKEAQFNKYEGQYIHYMYAKHILGENATIGINPTGKLNLSYTKSRNPKMTLQERQALGLIEDASVAVPVGMGKALIDIAKFDYLDALSRNSNAVWTPSVVKVGNRRMGIGRLSEEVKTMEKVARQFPDNPQVQTRFAELKSVLDKAIEDMGQVPEDFFQLPTTKSFGPLRGAFVRKPIADDIMPLVSGTLGHRGKIFDTLLSVEQKGVAVFKGSKVAANLPTVFRNVVSNILQNNMRGRPLGMIPLDIVNAAKSIKTRDKFFVESKKAGNFRTSWSVTEISDVINQFSKVKGNKLHNFFEAVKGVAKYYGKIDDIAKHTIFVQLRKKGVAIDKAALEAQKWGMDYSLASRSVKELRRHIMPFATYQYKIAPLIYESLTKRPWVIGKYIAITTILAKEAAERMLDMSDKDWTKMKKDLPLYIRKNRSYMIIPHKSPEGQWQWVNMEYYFPWGNWMAIFRDLKNKDFRELSRDTAVGNPFLDLFIGWKTGKDPFTEQQIVKELDSPSQQWLSIAEFIYNRFGPSMLSRYGAAGYTERVGEKDKWGRTVTPGQALGRWFGFNIVAVSPRQSLVIKKARIRELEKEFSKIRLDPSISLEEKKAAKRRLFELKRGIIKGGE